MTPQELIAYNNGFILGLVSKGVISNSESERLSEKIAVVGASASSQYSTDFIPTFAIDGNSSTMWASLNKSGVQYIQFDLGFLYTVTSIRAMCGSGYIPEIFDVSVSKDNVNFTPVLTGCEIGIANSFVDFIVKAVECKYIKLEMKSISNGNFYELREFEAYGYRQ